MKSIKEIAEEVGYLVGKEVIPNQPTFDGYFWLGGVFEITDHCGTLEQRNLLVSTLKKNGYSVYI